MATLPIQLRVMLVLLPAAVGCCGTRQFWNEPPAPAITFVSLESLTAPCHQQRELEAQRQQYALQRQPELALKLSRSYSRLAMQAEEVAVDAAPAFHYEAAAFSWAALHQTTGSRETCREAVELHHRSVARLVSTAQKTGKFSPGEGIRLCVRGIRVEIPLAIHNFVWQVDDFQELHPVGCYETEALTRRHQRWGWGVPLVVKRVRATGHYVEEPFFPKQPLGFAATAVLSPDVEQLLSGGTASAHRAALTLYDPLATGGAAGATQPQLAFDISAPFALHTVRYEASQTAWDLFLGTQSATDAGLFFIEPYQPGKIPVVFVHGLLSSPKTWVDLVNDLRAEPGFSQHYQIWGFRYATGGPFLEAAAHLRRDLIAAIATIDPADSDPALHHVVLLGHSMGGLVSKLQVVDSGDHLWRSIANRPLDQIVTSEKTRTRLAEMFYFQSQSRVRRVVYLGSPHQGSPWAGRSIGRLGSLLARRNSPNQERHTQLVNSNPGVFAPEVAERIPTSIDMLEPDGRLLAAIHQLQPPPTVRVHAIAGTGKTMLLGAPSDGIVPVSSAIAEPSVSTLLVQAKHTYVHRHPAAVQEVRRILREAAADLQREPVKIRDGSPMSATYNH